jgi:hypothetical protein
MGDYHFAKGINRFVLHVWVHKPDNRKPGATLGLGQFGSYGTEFNRNRIWWKPGKVWFDYLIRCQALLQSGRPVVDVIYFTGENQPARALLPDKLTPELPAGYTYNSINRDALLNRANVKNGSIILPGGLSSRILVLPESDRMTPEVAEKIAELSRGGVKVLGPWPTHSWSLKDYPDCDRRVREIVKKGWTNVQPWSFLKEVLNELKLQPDVVFENVDLSWVWRETQQYRSPSFVWGHRISKGADIYYLSNQEEREQEVKIKFRVNGRIPELWDPETGETRKLTHWWEEDDQTVISLRFSPVQSYFLIFRKKGEPGRDQKPNFPAFKEVGSIKGPWEVFFHQDRGVPKSLKMKELNSLHLNERPGVRYFSGKAVYNNTFELKRGEREDLWLDLGSVAHMAEVYLNGNKLGIVWTPPYRIELPDNLLKRTNKLEISVYNTWRNRIVGDQNLPKEERYTYLPLYPEGWVFDFPLVESGLLGPVTIQKEVYH